jgi:hypothetical protein
MAAYLRLDGLDPEDLDDADRELFNELANGVFAHLHDEAPDLYEQHEGVIPVRNVEHDPRLLEATAVYAHRHVTPDNGAADFVFCSFDDEVDGLDSPGPVSTTEWVEGQARDCLDPEFRDEFDVIPSEAEREQAGDPPVRIGTLYHDGNRVVRVDFDHDAFEDGDQV